MNGFLDNRRVVHTKKIEWFQFRWFRVKISRIGPDENWAENASIESNLFLRRRRRRNNENGEDKQEKYFLKTVAENSHLCLENRKSMKRSDVLFSLSSVNWIHASSELSLENKLKRLKSEGYNMIISIHAIKLIITFI